MPEIYTPSEDSYLMSDILKKEIPELLTENQNMTVLEIGAGSGIHLETLFTLGVKKQNIFSSDINQEAVKHCVALGFRCIHSDLFEKIKGKSNLIIFNPPYLPEDSIEPHNSKLSTTGGKNGSEIINSFLKNAKSHLEDNGKIFLITSSLTKGIRWLNYKRKIIGNKKLFFEKLYVWEITS